MINQCISSYILLISNIEVLQQFSKKISLMTTLNYTFKPSKLEDKENVQMPFKKPLNKGKVFGEKVNLVKEQFVTCKTTKF